eukprot:100734_1
MLIRTCLGNNLNFFQCYKFVRQAVMGNDFGTERTLCLLTTPLGIILVSISLTTIPFLLIVMWYGIAGLQCNKQLPQYFKIFYYFTCFVTLIAGISFPMQELFEQSFIKSCDNLKRLSIMTSIPFTTYMVSLICISIIYLLRYIIITKDVNFKVIVVVIVFGFGMLCQFVLCGVLSYLNSDIWYRFSHGLDFVHLHLITINIYLTFTVINTVYNILLLILFIFKVVQIGTYVHFHHTHNANDTSNTLTRLIDPIVICTLCLFSSILSSIITSSVGFSRYSFISDSDSNEMYSIHLTLFPIDVLINYLSLNLQFDHFQKTKLFHWFCGCTHKNLTKCMVHRILVKMEAASISFIRMGEINRETHIKVISTSPSETRTQITYNAVSEATTDETGQTVKPTNSSIYDSNTGKFHLPKLQKSVTKPDMSSTF